MGAESYFHRYRQGILHNYREQAVCRRSGNELHRYYEFMSRKYDEDKLLILYLSPDGSLPSESSLPREERENLGDRFRVVKYSEIRDWCNCCALEARRAGQIGCAR